jgi:Cys-tRNA(Pro)/Cys-tRNA(Cys) deacylase
METTTPGIGSEAALFERILALVAESGVAFTLHTHQPTRTMAEAECNLDFDITRIVKTIAFASRQGGLILAALRGTRRVEYPALAGLFGLRRRDLAALSPQEVAARLGVAPGGVSPLMPLPAGAALVIDADVLAIAPTLYCGTGRPDRTLELAPADLVRLTGARVEPFSH